MTEVQYIIYDLKDCTCLREIYFNNNVADMGKHSLVALSNISDILLHDPHPGTGLKHAPVPLIHSNCCCDICNKKAKLLMSFIQSTFSGHYQLLGRGNANVFHAPLSRLAHNQDLYIRNCFPVILVSQDNCSQGLVRVPAQQPFLRRSPTYYDHNTCGSYEQRRV